MTKTQLVFNSANVNSIDGDRLLDDSIENAKLESGIDGAKLLDGSIPSSKLDDVTASSILFTQSLSSVQRNTDLKLKEYISVKDYGAKGDGSDDTAAIQAAVDAVCLETSPLVINQPFPGSSGFIAGGPALYFPAGKYLVTSPIDVKGSRHVRLIGDGTSVIYGGGTRANNFLEGGLVRHFSVHNLHFQNFDTVFKVSTNNLDSSQWDFVRVRAVAVNLFIDSKTYNSSRSTIVSFKDSVFLYGVTQIAKIYCDQVTFYNCWIGSGNSSTNSIEANSNLTFIGCMFIPAGTQSENRAAVLLTNSDGEGGEANDISRGAYFYGCRMSNEGGQGPIIVCDYPIPALSQLNASPTIAFNGCTLVGFSPNKYEPGNSETGIVYLKQWPASVSFSSCSFRAGGSDSGYLVAKSDSLTSSAPNVFRVDIDDTSYANFQQQVGAVLGYAIADGVRSFIRNPDPYTLRNTHEDGYLKVVDTANPGEKKATFTLRTGYNDLQYATPLVFELILGGEGTVGAAAPDSFAYSGASIYLVTVSGFTSGSLQTEISYTKLFGAPFGNNKNADVDVTSIHFGTGDTGSSTTAYGTGVYDVTIAFGNNVANGSARLLPYFQKLNRYNNQLR